VIICLQSKGGEEKEMTWEERRRLVEECERSGQAKQKWCREKGIPYTTYTNWRNKIQKSEQAPQTESPIAKTKEPQTIEWARIGNASKDGTEANRRKIIRIARDGWTIAVEAGVDVELLTETLRAVKQLC
jgi:transposase-like protein